MPPEMIINMAKKRRLSGIAITDHNTIEGGLSALAKNEKDDFLIIVGTEVHSEIGDIIGLFLKEEITSRQSNEIVRQIHRQGGIAILPHPYNHHLSLSCELLASLDAVEVRNGRVKDYADRARCEIVDRYRLASTAGSDAHCPWEVGRAWTEVEALDGPAVREAILQRSCRSAGCSTPPSTSAILLSKMIKRYRRLCKHRA